MTTPNGDGVPATSADLDMGDALLDALRLHVGGNVIAAGLAAIPHLKRDPAAAGAFVMSLAAQAVRHYAHATGHDPVHAVDVLWSKPPRPASEQPRTAQSLTIDTDMGDALLDSLGVQPRQSLTTDPTDPRLTHGPDPADGPATEQADVYLVLPEQDRAAGFVRPVRTAYWHTVCGGVTTMHRAIAETYARNPTFYQGTYCAICRLHRPVGPDGEFHWVDPAHPERQSPTMDPKVGT